MQLAGLLSSGSLIGEVIPSISGQVAACTGNTGYIYATESGMSSYSWSVTSGGTIQSGNGTNSILVVWNSGGIQTVSVTYATATSPGTLNVMVTVSVESSVTIATPLNPVCSGSMIIFTASPVNGGTNPWYTWKINGITVGSNSPTYSYIPANGDEIKVEMNSSAVCVSPAVAVSNTITMAVSPNLPVSVSITTSSNPVCAGTVVTYNSIPVNGGTSPQYTWKVNGTPSGANVPTFAYSPENNDLITCNLTSSLVCASGNPAVSNSITMSVTPVLPVSISISASQNPICAGTLNSFTATSQNTGSLPSYQWKINGIYSGSTGPAMTYMPVDGDIITCLVTSSSTCTLGQTTLSNPLTMTVNPLEPVSVSISASSNPVCQNSQVTFTATPVNGGNSSVYQWMVNGFDAGTNSHLFQYIPANDDSVTCKLTSNIQCPSGNPAVSEPIVMQSLPMLPVSVSIAPSGNPVCAGSSVTFTATPINGGTTPSFQWMINGIPVGTGQNSYTYIPLNNDQVSCVINSSIQCATGSPATSNTVTMTVTPEALPGILISASQNPTCSNTSITFDAVITNGGLSPNYQWFVNGVPSGSNASTFQYTPVNVDAITCSLTSSRNCVSVNPVTSNIISMTVSPALPAGITIEASENPSCQGQSVTFTATPENGGLNPDYQWMVNNINVGSNSFQYTYAATEGDQVTCLLTSGLSCATGNPVESDPVIMNVNSLATVSVSIAASENPTCQGTEIIYTAIPVNGGNSPYYQWHANGINVGVNSSTFNNIPTDGQVITCTLTSNESCTLNSQAISNPVNMDVNPTFLVGISIAISANPVCQGETVTLTATELNGGSSPLYQWFVNNLPVGANSPQYSYVPSDGDAVTCRLTSSQTCTLGNPVISNLVIISVNSGLPVSTTVTPSSNPVCQGESVIFAAIVVNGGPNPSYQWELNGIPVGSNNDTLVFTPVNGNTITCEGTSNLLCVTSNPSNSMPVTITVNPAFPVSIGITPSENPVCVGTMVFFTAATINGGNSPIYQWQLNGETVGSNLSTYSLIPSDGDSVVCNLTSSVSCPSSNPASSNVIVLDVSNSLPASIQVAASSNPFCTGDEVTVTATTATGGNSPVFQWQLNGVNAGSNQNTFTFNPSNGDKVNCILTSSATCVTGNPFYSDTIEFAATNSLPVDIVIEANSNPVCQGMYVTFTADPVNEGETPDYQWQVNGVNAGTNNQSFVYMPVDGDVVTCILTSSLSCATPNPATSNAITIDVIAGEPLSIYVTANPAGVVCIGTVVSYTAAVINGGNNPVYHWSVNGTASGTNSPTFSYTPGNGDIVLCSVTSSLSCALFNPALSNPITMSVTSFTTVGISIAASANPVCSGTWVTYNATPVNGGTSPMYQWFVNNLPVGNNSGSFTFQPQNGDVVTCELTSDLTCTNNNPATSSAITMSVSDELPVSISIVPLLNPICAGSLIQFTAFSVNQGTSPHYQWKVNGVNVGNNNYIYQYFPLNQDQVSCVLTSSLSCASGNPATSNTISMIAYPSAPVSVSISAASTQVCQNEIVTVTASAVNPGTSPTYIWKKNGSTVGSNNPVYQFVPVSGDQINCILVSNAQCRTGSPATSNQLTFIVNQPTVVVASISASATTICAGNSVTFTASLTNGGSSPHFQWMVNGIGSGTDDPVFAYIPDHGDIVSCEVTSSIPCPVTNPVLSNTIMMTVSPILTASVSISSSSNPSCGGSLVTYTALPVNGGASPAYQWFVNNIAQGTGANTFTYAPANMDTIRCILTSSTSCIFNNPVESDSVIQVVSAFFPVSIIISPSMNPVCLGQTVLYTATATNAGPAPIYQWAINGIEVGINANTLNHVPSDNDTITCEVTSSYSCATGNPALSNVIVMEAGTALPASIQITASANPVCNGTLVFYSATAQYTGSNPFYEWKVNGSPTGFNQPTFSFTPLDGDQVICSMTSSYACASNNPASSNTIPMTVVAPQPCTATVSPIINPVCQGEPVTVQASVQNGGNYPGFFWMVNGSPTGSNLPFLTYLPANGDSVWCRVVSQHVCTFGDTVTSNKVVIDVSNSLTVSLSINTTDNPLCQGDTASFIATAVNGGSNPVFQWSVNGINVGSNADTYSYIPGDGDSVTCVLSSSISCATDPTAYAGPIYMSVDPLLQVEISITPSANPICENEPVTFTAFSLNGGSSPQYEWSINGVVFPGNQPLFSFIPANGDTVQCKLWSSEICFISNPVFSNKVVMMVNTIQVPVSVAITASSNPFCAGDSVIFNAVSVNGGTAPLYNWSINQILVSQENPFMWLPSGGDSVVCTVLSNAACAIGNPASSNTIGMQENPLIQAEVTISANPPGAVCDGTTVDFFASAVNGGTNPGFAWFVNRNPVGSNTPLFSYAPVDKDTVVVVMTTSIDCPVANPVFSAPVGTTVNSNLAVSVVVSATPSGPVCKGDPVTYQATPVNGGSNPVYQWLVNGTPFGSNASVLELPAVPGDKISCILTSNETCTSNNPSISGILPVLTYPLMNISYQTCVTITSRDARPMILKGGLPMGGNYLGDGVLNGKFYPNALPPFQDTSALWYRYTDMHGCTDSAAQTIHVEPAGSFSCGSAIQDIRDMQSYETILIGTQCWFRQNLNAGTFILSTTHAQDNCSIEKYCYENLESNCLQDGGLFQWEELMDYQYIESSQGICPPAWHIPSEAEWISLFSNFSGLAHAGRELKLQGSSGFDALLTGMNIQSCSWSLRGFAGFFWSSSSTGPLKSISHGLNIYDDGISTYNSLHSNAFSVRCIKD